MGLEYQTLSVHLERRVHLVKWNTITRKRKNGGLGVRVARFQNVALLTKLIWDILHHPNKLWVQVSGSKYPWDDFDDIFDYKRSYLVTSLSHAYNLINGGFQLQVGKGECSFWHDPWKGVTLLANDVDFVDI